MNKPVPYEMCAGAGCFLTPYGLHLLGKGREGTAPDWGSGSLPLWLHHHNAGFLVTILRQGIFVQNWRPGKAERAFTTAAGRVTPPSVLKV